MNHPTREEWVPYVFGEATAEVRRRLSAHLESCPECRAEIEGWQRSRLRLEAWKLPKPVKRAEAPAPVLRWAVAAAVVLGLGLVIGRITAPAPADVNWLRTEIAASVKSALATEFQRELAQAHSQTSNVLAALEVRLAELSEIESRQLLSSFLEVFEHAREQDLQATLSVLERIEREHAAAYVALRKDLETVASMTDDELRLARSRMIELAADLRPRPTE